MASYFYYQILATFLAQVLSKASLSAAWKESLINTLIDDYQLSQKVRAQLYSIVQGKEENLSLESTLSKMVLFTDAEQQQILITLLVFIHSFLGFTPEMEKILHLFLEKPVLARVNTWSIDSACKKTAPFFVLLTQALQI